MTFVVRIFFAGLVAFVPSRDGKVLTVLLPDAGQARKLSDGSLMEPHQALLVARAAGCKGDCGPGDASLASILFPGQPAGAAWDGLAAALQQGVAWRLDGVELTVGPPPCEPKLSIPHGAQKAGCSAGSPATAESSKDFGWVADLNQIVPGSGIVDPAFLGPQPPAGRIAARLRLQSGTVSAYRLVAVEGKVAALEFRPLGGKATNAAFCAQALADWVVAEIPMSGDGVELELTPWGKDGEGKGRLVKLAPENGQVDVVVLNVAPSHFDLPAAAAPGPGKHFEAYYELTRSKPSVLPVPYVPDGLSKLPEPPHLSPAPSALLQGLRLGIGKTVYDRLICPLAQLSPGGAS